MTDRASPAPADQGLDGLTALALLYLAIPNLIFVFGWFRFPVAIFLAGTLAYLLLKTFKASAMSWRFGDAPMPALLILATGFAWAAFGGGSHFMYANPDWIIRDAVLGDLVRADWPVIYQALDGAPLVLRSAIGYFLPPALFGKIFGTAHIDIAIYLWTVAGVLVFLFLLPLPRRMGWPLVLGLLLTVFFSGMDYLGVIIATQLTPIFPLRLEWWVPLSYPSLTGQLLWAPNHCLPIWIGTLLLFRHRAPGVMLPLAVALLPTTLIWTPFAAIGLAPFVLAGSWQSFRRGEWANFPWRTVVAAIAYALPVCLFLLTDLGHIDSSAVPVAQASAPASVAHQAVSLQSYLIFISCEFLLLALALYPHVRQARGFFMLAVALLISLPLMRYGPSNDILLRLSTPALVVLLAVCLQTLLAGDRTRPSPTIWIASLFLAIGAHTAFNELWRAASFPRWHADYRPSVADRERGQPAPHYVGRLESSPIRGWLRPVAEGRMLAPGRTNQRAN